MNGTIDVSSIHGKGSKFSISIPSKKFDPQNNPKVDFSKLSALIVEDNKVNAAILSAFLNKLKIKTEVAVDGKAGLDMFSKGNFNIIFMDVQMPVMNGLESTKLIRNIEIGKDYKVPIIGFTANAKKQECLDAGMDAFIQKPVTKEIVLETIMGVFLKDFI
jgi:CheY-like chemotaxis protein